MRFAIGGFFEKSAVDYSVSTVSPLAGAAAERVAPREYAAEVGLPLSRSFPRRRRAVAARLYAAWATRRRKRLC